MYERNITLSKKNYKTLFNHFSYIKTRAEETGSVGVFERITEMYNKGQYPDFVKKLDSYMNSKIESVKEDFRDARTEFQETMRYRVPEVLVKTDLNNITEEFKDVLIKDSGVALSHSGRCEELYESLLDQLKAVKIKKNPFERFMSQVNHAVKKEIGPGLLRR